MNASPMPLLDEAERCLVCGELLQFDQSEKNRLARKVGETPRSLHCRDCSRVRLWIGQLPGTSFRLDFETKTHALVPTVTIEQIRARESKQSSIPRWTHAAPDGSRRSCGIAHKDREVAGRCPAGLFETWAIVPINDIAETEDRHAEMLWRFAWIVPLIDGLRRAVRNRHWGALLPDETAGVPQIIENHRGEPRFLGKNWDHVNDGRKKRQVRR